MEDNWGGGEREEGVSQVKKGLLVEMGNGIHGAAPTSQVRRQGRPLEIPAGGLWLDQRWKLKSTPQRAD